ncbi:MAG: hypothetical protein JSU06_08405 [Actinobacteria bacterium]|nr:hypothetical protein [Actinomycetota bacterium]
MSTSWERRNAPVLLLGAALVVAAITLAVAEWHVTYFQDTWSFLLERQAFSAGSFLEPHNEHIVIVPVAITKALLAIFGMTSNTPEQVVMGITLLAAATLIFVYARRRVGPWMALFGAVIVLFLGSAWWTLLWPFENEFTLPLCFGLGALLVLERRDTRGDVLGCALLSLATISGSLGICFVAAAFVELLLEHRERGWRRAYVFAIPLLLYVAWYLGWGHKAEHHLTLANILTAPAYVAEGFASSLNALTGLGAAPHEPTAAATDWGPALLIAAVALIILGQLRRPGVSKGLWIILAAGVGFWLLAGINFIPGRAPSSVRYIYPGVVFTLLIAAELLRKWPLGPRGLLIAACATAAMVGPNLAQFKEGHQFLQAQTVITRADLAAIEIARDTVAPTFDLASEQIAGSPSLTPISAGPYLEAVGRWGSPAYSLAELEAAPEGGRHWADVVLSEALPITHETKPGFSLRAPSGVACATLLPGKAPSTQVPLKPGTTATVEVARGAPAAISLRRFAQDEFPVAVASVEGGTTTTVQIPRDRAPNPWYAHVEATQTARVCS